MTTEEIQQEIARTRDEMAGTIQAIEDKLSLRQLLNEAVETMREMTSGESMMVTMVRDNPVPFAIIGLGLGWLAVNAAMGRRSMAGEGGMLAEASPPWAGTEPGYMSAAGVGSSGYGAEGGEGFAPMGEAAQGMRERASQMARDARANLQRASDATRQRMTQWSHSAGDTFDDVADRTWEFYQEHPLTMALGAMAIGAAVGALLPRTRTEGRVMGGTFDTVVRQARDTSNEFMDRAGQVARNALRTVRRKGEAAAEAAQQAATPGGTMH